jgi:diacylglycerol kinase (ATP)
MQDHPYKGKTGLRRLLNAFRYSMRGFACAYRYEQAFRQELLAAALLVPVALLAQVGAVEKALLIASVLLVLIVELLNTAIEAAVDRISLDDHHLAGRAKDIGSAAVFLSVANAAVVWLVILAA